MKVRNHGHIVTVLLDIVCRPYCIKYKWLEIVLLDYMFKNVV